MKQAWKAIEQRSRIFKSKPPQLWRFCKAPGWTGKG